MTIDMQTMASLLLSGNQKLAYAPPPPAAPPMDPSMMGGAPPPMDPSMMGGAPPMDPSMMGGAPPAMPMDPSMMGGAPPAMPMDPSMMGGAPPMDPSMMGGMPPVDPMAAAMPPPGELPPPGGEAGGEMVTLSLDDLRAVIREEMGKGGEGGDEQAPSQDSDSDTEERLNLLEDMVTSLVEMTGAPVPDMSPAAAPQQMPPPGEDVMNPGDVPPDGYGGMDVFTPEAMKTASLLDIARQHSDSEAHFLLHRRLNQLSRY